MEEKKQQGITLIVSIILLASVSFISFALSVIILREITAARLLLRSEPAISGANAGGEVATFHLVRSSGTMPISGQLPESGVSYQVTADLYDDPYLFTVPPQSFITVGLYDAANPYNQQTGYGSVTITNTSSNVPVQVEIISWSDPENGFCTQNIGAGAPPYTCLALNSADDRYLITLTNNTSGEATGQISALDESGQSKGVPSNTPDLQITGTSGNVQRKIEIIFSNP